MTSGAWVTLIFGDRKYANGVAVLSRSIQKAGSKYPLYCMVTEDIAEDLSTVEFISKFATIIKVPYINASTRMKSKKQQNIYGNWINHSFTKWNILNPEAFKDVGLDKIIFIDADSFMTKNCDRLFDMDAPAMCFSSPWVSPYVKYGVRSSYIKRNREPFHGDIITADDVRRGLNHSIVGLGCLLLVEPSKVIFDSLLSLLKNGRYEPHANCISGPDEQALADAYLQAGVSKFTHIHQQYTFVVGKTDWFKGTPSLLQWYNSKPWLEDRGNWPDLKIWYDLWDEISAETGLKLIE